MICISLKELPQQSSLDEVTQEQHAALRKRFLKEAGRHYSREAWDDRYLKGLACVGAGMGTVGMAALYATNEPFFIVPALAGMVNAGQAWYKKREAVGEMVRALDRRTSGSSYDELEQRLNVRDFRLPHPSDEEIRDAEMNMYALRVMSAVAKNDLGFDRYPWHIAGLGVMGYGVYMCFSNPVAGGLVMAMGGLAAFGASLLRRRKVANIARRTSRFIREKGYDHFAMHIKRKDPYKFYHYDVMQNSCLPG